MANRAVLFVDLLGVQKMWRQGGAQAVKVRIGEFNQFIRDQINYLPAELHREGEYTVILTGDSVSVMCQDFDQAIGIGSHFFLQAFYDSRDRRQPFWLRGAIAPWHNQYLTLNTTPILAKGLQIGTQYIHEDDFLAVFALEKSGFRGMRLIIDSGLLQDLGRAYTRSWEGFIRPLGYVARLHQCTYPRGRNYVDVLWMTPTEEKFSHMKAIMATRFKKSTKDPDEFLQASWTRALFDQVETLVWACRNRPEPDSLEPLAGTCGESESESIDTRP